jgi:hypothetical protein
MLSQLNPHERDKDITFQEKGHIYDIKGDRFYKSCTTWVKSFFEKFDSDAIITRMMSKPDWSTNKYFGMTKKEIKDLWYKNGQEAAQYGTDMHAVIEDYYNGIIRNCDKHEYEYFKQFAKDHEHLRPFRTEMMIYDEDIRICGSVDMLFQNEDGTISIYDWKFAKELNMTSSYRKKALPPFQHMDDCNYTHYSLQLNMYRIILERKYGFKIRDMYLIFMHKNLSDNYVKVEVETIDIDTCNITPLVNYR